jgi:hypothetical protein
MTRSSTGRVVTASLVSFVVLAAATWASWHFAGKSDKAKHLRLRFYVHATSYVRPGARLSKANVRGKFGRLPADSGAFIASIRDAVGQYAVCQLLDQQPLDTTRVWPVPPTWIPPGGAIVAIQVKSGYTVELAPRMGLMFVQQIGKEVSSIPDPKLPADSALTRRGLMLLSLTPTGKDSDTVTLTVAMPPQALARASRLAVGDWRPVVLYRGPSWLPDSPLGQEAEAHCEARILRSLSKTPQPRRP